MVPVRLTLHNFLSYGEAVEPVDFTGMRVLCLSGNNGHGKSALLDAITWALWGQARTTSTDDLVRLGQSSMRVEFEFEFDSQRYRVIRKRTRGRTGQSDLQFQILNDDGSFRTLTEQGVRATQERINQTLRMDYETFINSAFILQGRADEFARKGATDRKRILSEILNLRAYDELMEAARGRARDAEQLRAELDAELRQIDAERAEEPRHQAAIARCQETLLEIQGRQQQLGAEREERAARKTALDGLRHRHEDLTRRLQTADRELAALRGQLATAQAHLTQARSLLDEGETLRQQVDQLAFARRQEAQMRERLSTLRRLEVEARELETAVQKAKSGLELELKLAQSDARAIRDRTARLPELRAEVEDLEAQVRTLDRLEEEAERAQGELQAARERRAELTAARNQYQQSLDEADERFRILKHSEARCPVCESDLKPEQRWELGCRLRRQRDDLRRQLADSEVEMQQIESRIAALERQVTDAGRKRKTGQIMRDRLAQARQTCNQLEEGARTLPQAMALAEKLEEQLASGGFAPEQRQALAALHERMQRVGYEEEEHARISERIQALQPAEAKLALLEAAERSVGTYEEQVRSLGELIEERERGLVEDRAAAEALRQQLLELPEVTRLLAETERECARVQAEAEGATRDLGAAQSRLSRLQELKETGREKRRERDAASRDKTNYEDLVKIFGRNGIQALIIENAIPEIEAEANAILERMTENGMKIAFMTQRDTKTAGVAETLDIEISDHVGTRRYELFSGGEALRANFAIRIALSKLLARRAGARLQTLVIDEGFGSQDAEGREKLVEAIHSVQDEFEKIIIITHLDELKDAFPHRLEVTKDHRGSHVTVMC